MTYTVADVDRLFDEGFDLPGYGDRIYRVEGAEAWLNFKWEELVSVPTELGVVSREASYGGEGQGDGYWVVVKIEGHDGSTRYFRKDGWYQSYSGGELDGDTYEVKPTPRTVTFYE